MVLSPTVRTVLTVVAVVVTALAVALPTLGAPVWAAVVVGIISSSLGALGIVPPQAGGVQVGLTSPTVVGQKPPTDTV